MECKDVPDGYEKIEADDIYIYNVYGDNEFDRADECLYTEMELAYRGEREVDKIANDAQQQINNGSGDFLCKIGSIVCIPLGFGMDGSILAGGFK